MDDSDAVHTTVHVIYHGRVQGVGFRAATAQIAKGYEVAGFVRNLPDGTVELWAQGAEVAVRGFLQQIALQFQALITRIEEEAVSQDVTMNGFSVRW